MNSLLKLSKRDPLSSPLTSMSSRHYGEKVGAGLFGIGEGQMSGYGFLGWLYLGQLGKSGRLFWC